MTKSQIVLVSAVIGFIYGFAVAIYFGITMSNPLWWVGLVILIAIWLPISVKLKRKD